MLPTSVPCSLLHRKYEYNANAVPQQNARAKVGRKEKLARILVQLIKLLNLLTSEFFALI